MSYSYDISGLEIWKYGKGAPIIWWGVSILQVYLPNLNVDLIQHVPS